jgi:rare lipoprotein A
MLSTGSHFSFAREGIKYGVGATLSIIASLIPNLVQSQTLEDLDVPLRPPMQVPICGKIQAKTKFALPDAGVKQQSSQQTGQSASESTQQFGTSEDAATNSGKASGRTVATKPAIKAPVGTFNQDGRVKEYSWLSDDTTVEDEPALKIKPAQEKSRSHDINATVAKKGSIDPSKVKVAKKPHCSGIADYYADQFHGRKTASGQLHDREKFTAAHRTLPFGTKLKVVNHNTGRACIVTVNDRGPFTKSRVIDLSCAAAKELGLMTAKSRLVDCYIVENE